MFRFIELRLPNENDNLILQTYASDKYWATILKIDLGEICSYTSRIFNENRINMILMKMGYLQ